MGQVVFLCVSVINEQPIHSSANCLSLRTYALHLFSEFDRARMQRDLLSFNSTMAVCAAAACWRHVSQLLSMLRSSLLQANAVTLATVAACATTPRSQLATLAALESAGMGTVRAKMSEALGQIQC